MFIFFKNITILYLFLVILTLSPSEHNPGLLLIYIFFDFSYYHQIKLGGHVNVDRLRSCTKINVEIDKISLLATQKKTRRGLSRPQNHRYAFITRGGSRGYAPLSDKGLEDHMRTRRNIKLDGIFVFKVDF